MIEVSDVFFRIRSSGKKCLGKTWSVFWGMRFWILLGVELSKVLKIWYVCTYFYLQWIWVWIRLDPSQRPSPLVIFQGLQGEMSPIKWCRASPCLFSFHELPILGENTHALWPTTFIHTSVTSVLKTDCRKKRGSCLLNLWCDNKLFTKNPSIERDFWELSKDATLNASRLHSWMDSCQCSNLSLQRIYNMFWTLEVDGWNNESVVLVMRWAHPQLSGKKRCSYQYQSRFNREAMQHAHVLLINLPSMVLFFDILLPE